MSEKPISPLRQRMLDDMNMRRFTLDTQRDYVRSVKKLAAFLGRSPDTATAEDLRAFQLHLTEAGYSRQPVDRSIAVAAPTQPTWYARGIPPASGYGSRRR
jgi:integrase/recombinase XerD